MRSSLQVNTIILILLFGIILITNESNIVEAWITTTTTTDYSRRRQHQQISVIGVTPPTFGTYNIQNICRNQRRRINSIRLYDSISIINDVIPIIEGATNSITSIIVDDTVATVGTIEEVLLEQISVVDSIDVVYPKTEEGILRELSHVASDIIATSAPSTVIERLAVVFGRIFGLEADYLTSIHTHNGISIDSLLFDIPILTYCMVLCTRSLVPIIRSILFVQMTTQDIIVYERLFQPVGITKIQYKSMMVENCIDWITVQPGTTLISEDNGNNNNTNNNNNENDIDYLYWVYEGTYEVSYEGSFLYDINRTIGMPIDDPNAIGFNGDMKFIYNLHRKEKQKHQNNILRLPLFQRRQQQKSNNNNNNNMGPLSVIEETFNTYPMMTTTIVGTKNATLLRINSSILLELMEHDDQLASSIESLLLKSLQRKVGKLLVRFKETTTITPTTTITIKEEEEEELKSRFS